MKKQIAENINILGNFCGKRDLDELTADCLQDRYGINQADVMVLFGGSILCGGDVLARAMQNNIAKKYVIVGGAGHTTASLRQEAHRLYPSILTDNLPEAEIFSRYIKTVYGLEVDYLETKSTNCGNNVTYLLDLLDSQGIAFQNIILCQDATMQRRMEAGLQKHVSEETVIINYAAYKATVVVRDHRLTYSSDINGMWDIDRYVSLLMGEIPRLTDNETGYGPRGKNFIAHVDIPDEVISAFEELKKIYGADTREANPLYASAYRVPTVSTVPASDRILRVSVPGSKSVTNRALLLATLADGQSTLRGVLFSDDSRHFLKCIQDLGFETQVDEAARVIAVTGQGGRVPKEEAFQYVGSAGTAARFLTAFLGVSHGVYHMDASEQMRKRPMAPLLSSLEELGCEVLSPETSDCSQKGYFPLKGYFPFVLRSHGFAKDNICIDINHSSQFLSALLISSCLSERDFTIQVTGSHGMSYIEMTRKMMAQFGVAATCPEPNLFLTKAGQSYRPLDYLIEPDVSSACYFYAMCPLLNIPVMVEHVHFDSLQGDVAFLSILEKMGCTVTDTKEGILARPPAFGVFHGVEIDMSACSDQAITLAAIAPFADAPTTIKGIGHIRFQECDRMNAIITELTKMGIRCDNTSDSITVYPGVPVPSVVNTYDDHRMAMGFSLIGLRSQGIVIDNPGCCRKTFEDYFEVLEKILYTFFSI